MNFNCIIKTGLVAVAAMVSLSSFSQDLIARQAPIDKKLKTVDSLALQKQIRAEQSEYPALRDRKSTRLNSSHLSRSRMPSSA